MTTNNHTAITTGAAANAATINSPLGELDAAIGNLATLTTTAKTSAVAAINEVDAALSLVEQPNVIFSPFNTWFATKAEFGNRARYNNWGNLTMVLADANNPYGGNTLRVGTASANAGKIVYLDESGIQIGERMSFGCVFRAASGTGALACRFYTVGNVALGTADISSVVTFSGAVQILTLTSSVIPATAYYVQVYMTRVSGSASIDIYAMKAVKGTDISTTSFLPAIIPYSLLGDLGSITTTSKTSLVAGINELDADVGALTSLNTAAKTSVVAAINEVAALQESTGRYYLRDWQAKLAKIQQLAAGEQAIVAFIGDSYVHGERIGKPMRDTLQDLYGDAGLGYVSASVGGPAGTTMTRAGTWTDSDPAGLAVDLYDANSSDTATPASITVDGECNALVIHYVKKSGGGSFRYAVDGGGWTTVATADATTSIATETISGLSTASHTLVIEVTVAGTGVTLLGIDVQKSAAGVRLHKFGHGGMKASDYLAVNAALWQSALAAFAPNLVIFELGTNEHTGGVAPATYAANMVLLAARVRAAMPYCDVMFLSQAVDDQVTAYAISSYVDALRAAAPTAAAALVDCNRAFNSYADALARGLMLDTRHPNNYGGQMMASLALRELAAE